MNHLIAAYKTRIENLDWMGAETKQKAIAKLAAMTKKLGYPDKWKDFSALEIGAGSYVQNYIRACVVRIRSSDKEDREACGPHGMVYDAADGECLLSSGHE